MLFLKVKDTNFESNSQLTCCMLVCNACCFWKSKIQILKAIHNFKSKVLVYGELFLKVKDTNFESNSQPGCLLPRPQGCCFWKSKIQILKAIHNLLVVCSFVTLAVSESQRYKFWKQFTTGCWLWSPHPLLFLNVKDTNFESNSQLPHRSIHIKASCFWKSKIQILKAIHNPSTKNQSPSLAVSESQRYKFWKQFTTSDCRG